MAEDADTSIVLAKGNFGPYAGKHLKMIADFRRATAKRQSSSIPKYTVSLVHDETDLEISVDHSNVLYGVNIILMDDNQAAEEEVATRSDLKKILGSD